MRNSYSHGAEATFRVVQVNVYEANLNIPYAEAMVYPAPNIFYSTSPWPQVDWFLSWLEYILEQPKIPQTISISYDYNEKDVSRSSAHVV